MPYRDRLTNGLLRQVGGILIVETPNAKLSEEGYRVLHSLKSIFPAGKGKGYVAECVCGWQSELRDFLTARSALTDHVLDEADKLMEGVSA